MFHQFPGVLSFAAFVAYLDILIAAFGVHMLLFWVGCDMCIFQKANTCENVTEIIVYFHIQ